MKTTRFFALALLCASPVLAQLPHEQRSPQPGGETQRAGELRALGYVAPVPAAWQPVPGSSRYRVAQYRVPGGAGVAELVAFYFGPGQGGSVEANVERWISQFGLQNGKPVVPKLANFTAAGLAVTTVELAGSYGRNVGMGQGAEVMPERMLLVAIVETPSGNLTIQLHGPSATVEAGRGAFDALARGLKKEP